MAQKYMYFAVIDREGIYWTVDITITCTSTNYNLHVHVHDVHVPLLASFCTLSFIEENAIRYTAGYMYMYSILFES